jgi:type VII secretion ATPase EccA
MPKAHTEPKKVNSKPSSNPLKELEKLIGLAGVKTEINNIYNLIKIQKVRTSKGLNAPDISYHCVFTGNPGTGKTTVARLVAQIYKQLGILTKGHLVETDRSGLVAEYVGQTAVKTNKIIDSALDGVLFIDEAYSLVQGGSNDYGLEAIATLLKRMEDNRDRLVVILAGYSNEMQTFIDSNPGLQSRFNRYIHFEDYSADELTAIFAFNLTKFDYKLTNEALSAIKDVMTDAVAHKDKNFGNARFVRNLFEKTLERQAKRLASSSLSSLSEEALTEITAEDIK